MCTCICGTKCLFVCGVCLMALQQGAMGRPLCICVACPIGTLREGFQGKAVVCPLVYSEKSSRGRLVCFYVVFPLVHPEKGHRGRLVLLSLYVVCLLVFSKREDMSVEFV